VHFKCGSTTSTVPKTRSSSLGRQLNALRSFYPDAKSSWKNGTLEWIGELQPTHLSRTYTLLVRYRTSGTRPVVTVLSPKLESPTGRKPPHVFAGNELCLHMPGEWDDSLLIAETVIPWASEWLFHYELWLGTSEWHGGGS